MPRLIKTLEDDGAYLLARETYTHTLMLWLLSKQDGATQENIRLALSQAFAAGWSEATAREVTR